MKKTKRLIKITPILIFSVSMILTACGSDSSSNSSSSSSSSNSSSSSSSSASSTSSSTGSSSSSSSSSSTGSSTGGSAGDWLHIDGNSIVDSNGRAVWLTGANWFGFNASERVFHGLWAAHFETFMQDIADHGINLLRVPISTELLYEWKNATFTDNVNINLFANPELEGMNTLDIFDYMLELAEKMGIKVLLDVHSAKADNSGHVAKVWYDDEFTEAIFYETWEWVAKRYRDNDTLIAFDLENEPHGQVFTGQGARWDDSDHPDNWKRVAQEASKRILSIHPKVLILIEGVEVSPKDGVSWDSTNPKEWDGGWWGGNLRGVRDHPVLVSGHQDQIMYSPHDYGPSVFDQDWFYEGFDKESMKTDIWNDAWLYIHDEKISPLLIGEWGGHMDGGRNQHWLTEIRDMMIEKKIHHTFWCINPNSGDTGGLIGTDWKTWDEEKYSLFEKSLWKSKAGEYVGLDQDTPLGSNGISVNQYYSNGGVEPRGN